MALGLGHLQQHAPFGRVSGRRPAGAVRAPRLIVCTRAAAALPDAVQSRANVKARLRQLVSKVNSAALPGPADLASLDAAITDLIALNPHRDSATSDLINGRWVLLYTASLTTLRQAARASGLPLSSYGLGGSSSSSSSSGSVGSSSSGGGGGGLEEVLTPLQLANDTAYKFFYTYVPVLAGAAVGVRGASGSGPVKARGNFQVFNTAAGRVENQARFEIAGRQCCVNVNGTAVVAQVPPGAPKQRLRATFTSFDLLVDGERRLSLPLSLLNPVGYVDTPFLDEDLRISIGDKGSVFIAAREGPAGAGAGPGA